MCAWQTVRISINIQYHTGASTECCLNRFRPFNMRPCVRRYEHMNPNGENSHANAFSGSTKACARAPSNTANFANTSRFFFWGEDAITLAERRLVPTANVAHSPLSVGGGCGVLVQKSSECVMDWRDADAGCYAALSALWCWHKSFYSKKYWSQGVTRRGHKRAWSHERARECLFCISHSSARNFYTFTQRHALSLAAVRRPIL